MRLKKVFLILSVLILTILLVSITTPVFAATYHDLGIMKLRDDLYAYRMQGKNVWKIVEYTNATDYNYNTPIYCLNGGLGFGSDLGISGKLRYNLSVDMKDKAAVNSSVFANILPTNNNDYNALLWLFDHSYIKGQSTPAERAAYFDVAGISGSTLTDSDIDVVQQIAMWYFTKNQDAAYKNEILPALQISNHNDLSTYQPLFNVDEYRNEDAEILYDYLLAEAKANAASYGSGNSRKREKPLTLNKTVTPTITINGPNYIIGPYKIIKNNDTPYNLNANFVDENGAVVAHTLLDSNKNPTSQTINQMVGQDFYVSVPTTTTINSLKMKIGVNYNDVRVTAWTVSGAHLSEQPVSIPEKIVENYEDEINVNITKKQFEFQLLKTVSGTQETLDGAVFKVKAVAADSTVLFDVTRTTTGGKISVPDIKKDGDITFTIKEVSAPTGFVLDPTEYKFVVNFNSLTGTITLKDKFPTDSNVKVDNNSLIVVIDIANKKEVKDIFDLALRKFITKVNDGPITSRIPVFSISSTGKYVYNHPKTPVFVKSGDLVEYTIRIYNEGDIPGYAQLIRDNIPQGLEFVPTNQTNLDYRWTLAPDGKSIVSDYLSKEQNTQNLLEAFDKNTMSEPDYKDVKAVFKVIAPNTHPGIITNIAEIAEDAGEDGKPIEDIDSVPDNGKEEEDDIDVEHIILGEFDLALRKFTTKISDTPVTSRIPVFSIVNGKYVYTHPKNPLGVRNGDLVEYTIRVYNEGSIAGFAELVRDNIPAGLEYVIDNETNMDYRWKLSSDLKSITTDYLSKAQGDKNLLKAFDPDTMNEPDYRDLKVIFKVIAPNTHPGIITNIAEIADDADEDGNEVEDIDSVPDNDEEGEDDIDEEHIELGYFDLALRKFITQVNDKDITVRVPVVTVNPDGSITYTHPKDPVLVAHGALVTYTIRIYNEGPLAGFAKEVKDNVPDGLIYLPDHELNKEYRWILSSDGKSIRTDYLSKEQSEDNLLKGFDPETMNTPDFRDVKVVFKVTEENISSERIITNIAEISDDSDEDGNEVEDIDSEPDNDKDGEDDIDEEHVRVLYFDLALQKWVSKVIQIENGKVVETETGHTGEMNPEPVVKVEIDKNKLNKVIIKFEYTIKIINEGEIAGYAKEVTDYIPEGLEFIQADNPQWYKRDGNRIATRALENTLLQPGESAMVKVIFKWKNSENNLGLKVNIAEISKDENEHGAEDIDSVPDNEKPGEDDIDDAPVILTLKTGGEAKYITMITMVLVTIGGGIILIKKFVL